MTGLLPLVLASPAASEVAIDSGGRGCEDAQLQTTAPLADAVDVPLDLVPTLLFSDCGGTTAHGIVRLYVGEEQVYEARVESDAGDYGFATVPVELEAETDYVLSYSPADGSEDIVVGWTTGTLLATPLSTGPGFRTTPQWYWDRPESRTGVSVQPDSDDSPHGPTFVELRDAEGAIWGTMIKESGNRGHVYGESIGPRAQNVCLTLFQRDVDGTWVEGGTDCLDGKAGGCSTGAGMAGWLPSLLLLVGLRRRR